MPHYWVPLRSNPTPWPQKKNDARRAAEQANGKLGGFWSNRADTRRGYALIEDPDDIDSVCSALGASRGDVIELDPV
jgi:hypothetical protein